MMYNLLFYLLICVVSSNVCLCERRITNGRVVATGKKYMVYLVNSPFSANQPQDWLCGGVLISTLHVLTAAACLTEVSHIYVIAGYNKYVSGQNILDDQCTATRKQKIVRIIIPKAYDESFWMRYDVGIGVVEKHYDFFDVSYRKVCSNEPGAIPISYESEFEMAGDSAVAVGWGAANARKPGMGADNSKRLMQTHAIITNSTFCRLQFPKGIEYLFLCTYGLNDVEALEAMTKIEKEEERAPSSTTNVKSTHVISSTTIRTSTTRTAISTTRRSSSSTTSTRSSSTTTTKTKLGLALTTKKTTNFVSGTWRCGDMQFSANNTPEECIDLASVEVLRRKFLSLNETDMSSDAISDKNKTLNEHRSDLNRTILRRKGTGVNNYGGICQNDHGGPLVTLVGQQERLIGIALNSVYNKDYQCYGPSLYLSTFRAKDLIHCLLAPQNEKYYVPKRCQAMNFEVKKYNVSWPDCKQGACEDTWRPKPKPERPVSVPLTQPVSPAPMIPPKTALPSNTRQEFTPTPSKIKLPAMPDIPPNYNIPQEYSDYPPENYKIPLHYTYATRPRYSMGLPYKIEKYRMRMPYNMPSYLKMGFPYNPSNYNKGIPYNPHNYKHVTAKRPPYPWS